MINDDCRNCSQIKECNGFDIPCMAKPETDCSGAKKIAYFAFVMVLISAIIIAGAITIAHHKANQNYQQVKK